MKYQVRSDPSEMTYTTLKQDFLHAPVRTVIAFVKGCHWFYRTLFREVTK
jgi:hypothetical protein